MKMPKGFPRLFVGDGVTPFVLPAMCWNWIDKKWINAKGSLVFGERVFSDRAEYALPRTSKLGKMVRPKVSERVRERVAVDQGFQRIEKIPGPWTRRMVFSAGWNAHKRWMKKGVV